MSADGTWSFPRLAALDARGQSDVAAASTTLRLRPGDVVFEERAPADSFFVVLSGAVELSGVQRGDEAPSVLRRAAPGESFGEEASLPGAVRRVRAVASEKSRVLEVPLAVFVRALGRGSRPHLAEREQRALRRAATRDLIAMSTLGRDLERSDLEILLDAARPEERARGEALWRAGDPADAAYLVADGVVQLVAPDGAVRAYLARGDLLGEDDAISGEPRALDALASGESHLVRVAAPALRTVLDRNPGLDDRVRRAARARDERQARLADVPPGATQHVLRDVYRLSVARSLLVIDQDACVRCGHCAWACQELHGVSRLVRRGDKVVTALAVARSHDEPASLLLPNSCQHCRNAACLPPCPTGAIGRDPEGEVFIREELCTGCGACAKACPWENIRMAPRPGAELGASGAGVSADLAVKCDSCRGYEAPACVESCPTDAIVRLEPTRDFAELRTLFGGAAGAAPAQRVLQGARSLGVSVAALALCAGAGLALHREAALAPGRGAGLALGVLALAACVGATLHGLRKRAIRRFARPRARASVARRQAEALAAAPARSRVAPWLGVHGLLGSLAAGAALAHAGLAPGAGPGGLALASLLLLSLSGAAGALVYGWLPTRLTRLETRGALPEDLPDERRELEERLLVETSGRSDLVKALLARVILPYARAPLGWVPWVLAGHDVPRERALLRARIDGVLAGRGEARLDGLDRLIRTAVSLRALGGRRTLGFVLRAWLPLHLLASAALVAALVVHVAARLW